MAADGPDPIVVARGLERTYVSPEGDVVRALDGVDLDVYSGQLTVVAGPSGSGKSTLLQVLAGLDRPDKGTVSIAGEDITRIGDAKLAKLRRRRLGFVFQSFNLIDSLTARDNIRLPLELDGRSPDREHMEELAARLGIADRLDHFPYQLSGGQQQRVAVIRALVSNPDVIFADEPTAALDPISGRQLIDLMLQIAHDEGHAVVAISHDPAVAASGDRVFRMEYGQLTDQTGHVDSHRAGPSPVHSPPTLRVDVRA